MFEKLHLPTARRLHGNVRAAMNGEGVGFGLAVLGAIVAIVSITALLFVPVETFTILDGELGAGIGAVLLIAGVAVHSTA